MLTPIEQEQILYAWNAPAQESLPQLCVHQLVEAQVLRSPDAVAVVSEEEQLTYGELNRRANQLAHILQAQGVGPDTLVGLCLERSLELVVGMLAVLKAGGAYVPLDPGYPAERLAFLLRDAQVKVLLTHQSCIQTLPESGARVVYLDAEWPRIASASEEQPSSEVQPEHLAYVIYTSGSTGAPKGVMIAHHNTVSLVKWAGASFSREQLAGVLASTSICFDLSVFEILVPLCWGGTVLLIAHLLDLPVLPAAQRITLVNTVPSVLTELLRVAPLPSSVRSVNLAGEPIPVSLIEQVYAQQTVQELFNLYGPTEDTTYSTWTLLEQGRKGPVVIGRPLPGKQAYLLDAALQLVPVGVVGELYLGGEGLTRGYLQRPELTAARFVPHPWSTQPGARLYRTGDLARYQPDGNIEYLGRRDEQVKLRGYRIEPGEIETTLRQHFAVREAAVMVQANSTGEKRLVGYVTLSRTCSVGELRRNLQERLPAYMVPGTIFVLDALPLLPNGKLDRHALPLPEERPVDLAAPFVAPGTAIEVCLAEIWAAILKREHVGIHDNFFEMGGDSILSIQIIAQARQAGLYLTARQVFEHQTVAELAAAVATLPALRAEQGLARGPVRLTAIQRWFFEQRLPEPHYFNQALLLEARDTLNVALLERALHHLGLHHDALRLRFQQHQDVWQQVYAGPEATPALLHVDLRAIAAREQRVAIETIATHSQASLDSSAGPLFRAVLFDLGQGQPARLLLVSHHLLIDGVSWRILLTDLQLAYRQVTEGEPIHLLPKTTSMQQWAQHLSEYAQTPALQQELTYWLTQGRTPMAPLPRDYPEGSNTRIPAHSISTTLSEEETQVLLREVPAVYHTQISDLLLTGLAQAFTVWTGQSRLLVDLEGHGREEFIEGIDLSHTVGWFTTLFPVLLDLEGVRGPAEAIKAIKEQVRQVPQHGIGYGLLRYLSNHADTRASLQALPQATVSFNYLGQFDQMLTEFSLFDLASEASGPTRSHQGSTSYLLEINAIVVKGQLSMVWRYSRQVYNQSTIEQLAQGFLQALRALIVHCRSSESGGYTPSDFPQARLKQQILDRFMANLDMPRAVSAKSKHLEDIYELSSMQQGMLFHTLYAPKSGVYIQQMVYRLHGNLDRAALQQAWQQVTNQHPVLRTAFYWQDLETPLQVVFRQVVLPWYEQDWRELPPDEQQERLQAYLSFDRIQDFDLTRAPLMRLCLIRFAQDTYRLVWSYHHILLDGWSLPILFQEVFACYEAICEGQRYQLEVRQAYREYIGWLQRQDLTRAEVFWRQALRGVQAPTSLEVDRSAVEGFQRESEPRSQRVSLPAELTAALHTLARQQRLTLNTLVQGAWALLLSRYSGREEVVFGVTVSGRPSSLTGVEGMIGLFINTLPLRLQVPPTAPLIPWLQQLQAQHATWSHYEHSPLTLVQQWGQVPRDAPLFESVVIFENYPVSPLSRERKGTLQIEPLRLYEQTNYALTLEAVPGTEFGLHLSYQTSRFKAESIKQMLGHLQTLLEGMVTHPQQPLASLPLLTAEEQHQLLVEWNATRQQYREEVCLPQLFEEQAERTPEAVAVVYGDEQLSYWELNRRANALAHFLRKQGIGDEEPVGICMQPSPEMLVSLLGVLKAGGAYVPLDPSYPSERLSFMLEESQISVLLTQQPLLGELPWHDARAVCLDTGWEEFAREREENPARKGFAEQLAYVIYTSGSTGKPKGVQITHRALVNFLHTMRQRPGLTERDRLLAVTSLSFDIAALELFLPLIVGACVVLVSRETAADGALLAQKLTEAGGTVMQATPATWQILLQAGEVGHAPLKVLCGGEAVSREMARRLVARGTSVWNLYGPTETTIWSSIQQLEGNNEPIPIGRPIANTQIYVLDRYLRLVPVGVPGELHIGGDGVARGYLHRPELTAERFIPDPWSGVRGARLYKTGDLARLLPNGTIEYLGRLDQQVKLRGYRVELGEIEVVLEEHPDVREAVVVAHEDMQGDKRLVAYVVPHTQQKPTVSDLRSHMQARLPDYMLPSTIMLLELLPLTPNGKLDRRMLPRPTGVRLESEETFMPPRGPIEEALVSIWADVLRLERVGIHDHFFDLGGHSLLVTQVIGRVRQTLQVELSVRALFEAPTVATLARRIEALSQAEQGLPVIPLHPFSREGNLPLSFAQQRIWFFDQLEPESSLYNISLAVRLQGDLKVAALEQSLDMIAQRHEVLRTTFPTLEDHLEQCISPTCEISMPVVDVTALPENWRELQMQQLATEVARSPFDLARGPVLRTYLLRIDHEEHVLLLCLHHIVSDGWSLGVLLRELSALYASLSSGKSSPLPELAIQYADYTLWQREWLQEEALAAQLSYWREQLAGAPLVLEMPSDRPRPAVLTWRGSRQRFLLPLSLLEALKRLSQRENVTLFMTLLAAWQTLLWRYSGQDDLLVGTPIANRTSRQVEELIGCFINTLVLRGDLSGDPSFVQLLKRTREVALEAYAHQDLPFEQVVEALQPQRDLSRTPLFQVMFSLQNASLQNIELPGLRLCPVEVEQTTAKFELTLTMQETARGLLGVLEYNTDLFEAATIVRMVGHWQRLLEGIVADPQLHLSCLPLLIEAEREQLLVDWNQTSTTYPIEICLHRLFEDQVARTPDAIAAIFADHQLTYRELDRRANQLAHYLQRLGVKPDVLVGICLERSLELLVGFLGTLKAGGAYVPLDPGYPPERLSFMLADAMVPVLLTQKRLRARLPATTTRFLFLDSDWQMIAGESAEQPESDVKEENLAYVLYTSGSTGQPKGVMVSHRAISNHMLWMGRDFPLTQHDKVLQKGFYQF